MKVYNKPLLAFFLALVLQIVFPVLFAIPGFIIAGFDEVREGMSMPGAADTATQIHFPMLALQFLLVGYLFYTVVLGLMLYRPLRMIDFREAFTPRHLGGVTVVAIVVLAIATSMGLNMILDTFDIPDFVSEFMADIMRTPLGLLYACLMGPIVEELTFRGAIQGWLHRHGVRPWVAIVVASVAFGIMHMNPLQIVFASLLGMVLGYVYWRTGSLWLPCLIHICNNTLASLSVLLMPEGAVDQHWADILGSGSATVILGLVIAFLSAAALWYVMRDVRVEQKFLPLEQGKQAEVTADALLADKQPADEIPAE